MGDPERGWATRDVELAGRHVKEGEEVWVHRRGESWVEIEHRGHQGRVPLGAVSDKALSGPTLEDLRRLDACFGLADDAFTREHLDREQYFEIRKCMAHGRRFLWAVGPRWTTIVTLLAEDDPTDPSAAYAHYHPRTERWHQRLGRTLFC